MSLKVFILFVIFFGGFIFLPMLQTHCISKLVYALFLKERKTSTVIISFIWKFALVTIIGITWFIISLNIDNSVFYKYTGDVDPIGFVLIIEQAIFTITFFVNLFISLPLIIYKYSKNKDKKDEKKKNKAKLAQTIAYVIALFPVCVVLTAASFISMRAMEEERYTVKKPVMYIYPEKEMDLNIKFGHEDYIEVSYPKYKDSWNIHVDTDGTIYDYDTDRNYYALYWEAKDNVIEDFNDGFVVKGEDVTSFLEEKLEILGLNEREINEFIIYWLPIMEKNKYNLIRFRTTEEVNEYMPLEISENPDTLIRVIMDFKALDKKITVKEQKLEKVERKGYTIVEWGGRELK